MSAEHWNHVQTILLDALEKPSGQRATFLNKACGKDRQLRAEVVSLLEAADEADDYFSNLAERAGFPPTLDLLPLPLEGQSIGPYRILQRIGEGGMGSVYLAERADGHFQQQVALKLLHPSSSVSAQTARFRAERQILASFDHPNIAQLLDGGSTKDGRPYLVMEYIKGTPITEYCQTHRLTVRERLKLFRQVAQAVQYAHRNLIIHRDLKPANILVTAEGQVKLLDFGIAKLLEGASLPTEHPHTRTGLHPLTPVWASPEQIQGGAITTASDVYQLGVLLYRLLTGAPPLQPGNSLEEMVQMVVHTVPTRPSLSIAENNEVLSENRKNLRRKLQGDLDSIVLRALRKNPSDRYTSAEQLAEDIRQYETGRPVLARKGSWRYRARKFLARNRLAVSASAVITLLLFSYFVTLTVYNNRLERERNLAQIEAAKATQVSGFLVDLFEVSDPLVNNGDTVTARALLDAGAKRLRQELDDQPAVHAQMAATIAKVYNNLGLHQQAHALAEEALTIRRRLSEGPTPAVVENLLLLASTLNWTENNDVITVYEQALQAAEQVYGPDHPVVARVLTDFGRYSGIPKPQKEQFHQRALKILRTSDDTSQKQLADALVVSTYGSYDYLPLDVRTKRLYKAIDIYRSLYGEKNTHVANALSDLALNLEAADPLAADTLLRKAVAIHRSVKGLDHPETLSLMNNHAAVLRDQNRFAEAEPIYQEVLRVRRLKHPEDQSHLGYTLYGLGRVLTAQNKLQEAEPLLEEALGFYPESDVRLHYTRVALAKNLTKQKRYSEASKLLHASWTTISSGQGPSDSGTRIKVLQALISLYKAWDKPRQASLYRTYL